jgi:hypothetical protein
MFCGHDFGNEESFRSDSDEFAGFQSCSDERCVKDPLGVDFCRKECNIPESNLESRHIIKRSEHLIVLRLLPGVTGQYFNLNHPLLFNFFSAISAKDKT